MRKKQFISLFLALGLGLAPASHLSLRQMAVAASETENVQSDDTEINNTEADATESENAESENAESENAESKSTESESTESTENGSGELPAEETDLTKETEDTGESSTEADEEECETEDEEESETEDEEAEKTEQVEELQERIDRLPDLQTYDYLPISEKAETEQDIDEMQDIYFDDFDAEQRQQTDAAPLLGLAMYTKSYAYYQTEEEYDSQLTLDDMETRRLSRGGIDRLQDKIDQLPNLDEVVNLNTSDEVSYLEDGGSYLSDEEMDVLYQDVYQLAASYYSLPEDQTAEMDSDKITALTAYFSVGASSYAAQEKVGMIKDYQYCQYSGKMTSRKPRYGYYEVESNHSQGQRIAFCMDSNAATPGMAGTKLYREQEVTDRVIRTILYYGYGGPGELVSHDMNGYFETHMAICYADDKYSTGLDVSRSAYKLLYQNAPDPDAWEKVHAWYVHTGVSNQQKLVYAIFDEDVTYTLNVRKYGSNHRPLSGVTYALLDPKTGEVISSAASDKEGKVSWDNLEAGDYLLRETATCPGYSILAEDIPLSIPFRMTQEEMENSGLDSAMAHYDPETKSWCLYETNYEITDEQNFCLPMTGGMGLCNWPFILLTFGGLWGGLFLLSGRRILGL